MGYSESFCGGFPKKIWPHQKKLRCSSSNDFVCFAPPVEMILQKNEIRWASSAEFHYFQRQKSLPQFLNVFCTFVFLYPHMHQVMSIANLLIFVIPHHITSSWQNSEVANLTQYNMQYIPYNSALLAQIKHFFCPKISKKCVNRDKIAYVRA